MKLDLLSLVIIFPIIGAIPVFFMSPKNKKVLFDYTLLVTLVEFLLSLFLLKGFKFGLYGFQYEHVYKWIPSIGASFHIGIDGMSLILILLTTFLTALGILSSYNYITHKAKEYVIVMLLMETGMIGVFASLDLLLFYLFWELMLIPMYFLIGIWGHERRVYAAFKFVIYTMAGSALLITGILVLYFYNHSVTGVYTFDLLKLYRLNVPYDLAKKLFLAFAIAFAIKVPIFPFHTWLPDAHVEAPTAGSVLLAGILLKMGIYGFLRFAFPLFPKAAIHYAPLFMALGIVGIIYGAFMSWVQKDLKKLVAYSSVAHLGFIVLGIFTFNMYGTQGAVIQMVNHGLSTGALFFIVGMLYERRHTRLIEEFGGLAKVMPVFSVIFGIVMLSSIGLPGLNGFIGEFLVMLGAFKASKLAAYFAVVGIIFAAVYMLTMFQKVVFLKVKEKNLGLPDISLREFFVLTPILLFIFWIGIYPKPYLKMTEPTSSAIIMEIKSTQNVEKKMKMLTGSVGEEISLKITGRKAR